MWEDAHAYGVSAGERSLASSSHMCMLPHVLACIHEYVQGALLGFILPHVRAPTCACMHS